MGDKVCQDGVRFQCFRDDLWPSHPWHHVVGGFPEWKLIWARLITQEGSIAFWCTKQASNCVLTKKVKSTDFKKPEQY